MSNGSRILPQSRFPGDICTSNNDCFGNSACNNSICVSAIQNGQPCEGQGSGSCPPGKFCSPTNTCVNTIPAGSYCSLNDPRFVCGFMQMCYKNMSDSTTTCRLMNSLPSKTRIISESYKSLCVSNYAVKVYEYSYDTEIYCMPGPVSKSSLSTGVLPGTECPYIEYNSFVWNGSLEKDKAKCGYSSSGLAFCDSREGDPQYATLIDDIIVGIQKTNLSMCHHLSNALQCAAFLKNVPDTF